MKKYQKIVASICMAVVFTAFTVPIVSAVDNSENELSTVVGLSLSDLSGNSQFLDTTPIDNGRLSVSQTPPWYENNLAVQSSDFSQRAIQALSRSVQHTRWVVVNHTFATGWANTRNTRMTHTTVAWWEWTGTTTVAAGTRRAVTGFDHTIVSTEAPVSGHARLHSTWFFD